MSSHSSQFKIQRKLYSAHLPELYFQIVIYKADTPRTANQPRTLYRVILKVAHKRKELIEGMKFNNFIIGTLDLRSNPEPEQGCERVHPSPMYGKLQ